MPLPCHLPATPSLLQGPDFTFLPPGYLPSLKLFLCEHFLAVVAGRQLPQWTERGRAFGVKNLLLVRARRGERLAWRALLHQRTAEDGIACCLRHYCTVPPLYYRIYSVLRLEQRNRRTGSFPTLNTLTLPAQQRSSERLPVGAVCGRRRTFPALYRYAAGGSAACVTNRAVAWRVLCGPVALVHHSAVSSASSAVRFVHPPGSR